MRGSRLLLPDGRNLAYGLTDPLHGRLNLTQGIPDPLRRLLGFLRESADLLSHNVEAPAPLPRHGRLQSPR